MPPIPLAIPSIHTPTIRLLTIGDSGAGKSAILTRYTIDTFDAEYMTTIGIDFRVKTETIDGHNYRVQVWDSAGQERFRSMTANYYRDASGILLVYDITKRDSFDHLRGWISDIEKNMEEQLVAGPDVSGPGGPGRHPTKAFDLILVGNKLDLSAQRVVTTAEGHALAEEHKIPFFETSAMTGEGVVEAMACLCRAVIDRQKFVAEGPVTMDLRRADDGSGRSCC